MKIKKPSRKETEIQSSIMELLTLYRIKRWRQKNEVKRPENKKRPPAQIAHINEVNELGGLAFFATSVNDVIKVLKKEGYIK